MNDHPSQAPSIENLAELLPQYGIDSFIAQGGMGAVYRGRQLSLDRDVAIKVLLNEFGDDDEFRESFNTEAKAMARLSHTNLLGVFDFGDIEGMPFIVMEYVEGGSLHEAAWDKVIEPAQAVEIINSICKGLAHAHENGIIHRDIKPANILLTLKAEPKVADFGLAHAHDSGESGLNMGTPGFTAPEVFNDPNQAGEIADIYSVGVIFHQLLTGIDPTGRMEPPSQATGNIKLDAIWRKATHINPKQRYTTISAMSADLEKWSDAKLAIPAPATNASASYSLNQPIAPRVAQPVNANTGGGIYVKVAIIFILLGAIAFTYQLTQKKEKEITPDLVDAGNINEAVIPDPGYIPGLDPLPIPAKDPVKDPNIATTGSATGPTTDSNPKSPDPAIPSIGDNTEDDPPSEPKVANNNSKDLDTPPAIVPEPRKTAPKEEANLPPGDIELRARAIGLIQKEHKKLIKELAKKDYSDKKGDKEAYISQVTVIRNAYVARLEKNAAEASDEEHKSRLLQQAKRASDLDAWIALLTPELEPIPEAPLEKSNSVIGKWDQYSVVNGGENSRWIAHANGRMEIVGKDWEVTWKLLEDGTLQVDWNKIRPYLYKRDGDDWVGTTSFGKHTTLKRGTW